MFAGPRCFIIFGRSCVVPNVVYLKRDSPLGRMRIHLSPREIPSRMGIAESIVEELVRLIKRRQHRFVTTEAKRRTLKCIFATDVVLHPLSFCQVPERRRK